MHVVMWRKRYRAAGGGQGKRKCRSSIGGGGGGLEVQHSGCVEIPRLCPLAESGNCRRNQALTVAGAAQAGLAKLQIPFSGEGGKVRTGFAYWGTNAWPLFAASWDPTRHNNFATQPKRKAGRPPKRWEDDLKCFKSCIFLGADAWHDAADSPEWHSLRHRYLMLNPIL